VPKEYDVKDVHLYISDVMKLTDRQKMQLWMHLVYGESPNDGDELHAMRGRFERQCAWVQANILYRFGPIIDKIVREEAQRFASKARELDRESA
jgi:hypothetical protein